MSELREVVVCEPLRTPIGRFGAALRNVAPAELAATVFRELLVRTGIDGGDIDDVILGQGYPTAEAPPIGRVAALDAGLPVTVGGLQVDRRCGSGLQAVLDAAMQIQTGVSELCFAGGVDSMSQAPLYTVDARWGVAGTAGLLLRDALGRGRETAGGRHRPIPGGMLETAENLRREYRIPREEQDALALRSHRRAIAAIEAGLFADEIVSVSVPGRRGTCVLVERDEGPRADTTLEALAALAPVRRGIDAEATVTAGNASGQNDAAAACLVTTPARARELGLRPLVRLVSWPGSASSLSGWGSLPQPQLRGPSAAPGSPWPRWT